MELLHQGEIRKVGTEQHRHCRRCRAFVDDFNNTCAKIGPGFRVLVTMPLCPHDDSGRCDRLVRTMGWTITKKYCHSFRIPFSGKRSNSRLCQRKVMLMKVDLTEREWSDLTTTFMTKT